MAKEWIKDWTGKKLGYTEWSGTKLWLCDFYGRKLGYYDKSTNCTHDFYGRRVGQGNTLMTLLR